ncbi:MAG: cytochrome b [Gammaproteobacteria bacterium]|nr:cytochrome b [Gammaproteobacteria bacterium]
MPELTPLYPLWLRIWHWTNVVLFLALLVTGISLHFAAPGAPLIPFDSSRFIHNVCGVAFSVNYLVYLVWNALSGNWRHYIPQRKRLFGRMLKQTMYYARGIFIGEAHPFPPAAAAKFNPLQQMSYLLVMYAGMPILIGSGFLYLFPEVLPDHFLGMDGLWPVAVIHYLLGLFLAVFMLGHIYLATAGETVFSEFRKMLKGECHD